MGFEALKELTNEFFSLHWADSIEESYPAWSDLWHMQGAMPNHDKQGVYAFMKCGRITYVGLGAGKGKPGYERHGLGARVNGQYMRLNEDCDGYYPVHPKLEGADGVLTIGFPKGYGYLAASLEQFLISKLDPVDNHTRAGS